MERSRQNRIGTELRRRAIAALWLLSVAVSAWPPAVTAQDGAAKSAKDIDELIYKTVAGMQQAFVAIPRARGNGTYRETVTDKTGKLTYQVRATFHMAYDHPKEFIQFRYEPGAQHGGYADARVVMSDGEKVYDALFDDGFHPHGVWCKVAKPIDKGTLDPVLPLSWGEMTRAYGYIDRLRELRADISLDDDGKLKVLQAKYPNSNGSIERFWIDPSQGFHIVRFQGSRERPNRRPQITTEFTPDWAQKGTRWFVKRCTLREVFRGDDDEVSETHDWQLVLDTFEPDVSIPKEVFTIHAIGLADGTPIREEGGGCWHYTADPNFNKLSVGKVVGELPVPILPR
jgi:hypothetical protein